MTAPDAASPLRLFGRDHDDREWIARLKKAEAPLPLGELGAYELIEEVGRGGQGVVFRARRKASGEMVALKRLRSGAFASEATRIRLAREARTISDLDHPGIVGVREVLEIDGQPVLVLDWVEGVPITRWAAGTTDRSGSLGRRLAAVLEVARAVAHAHERGVLHRDLKPSNVLVDDGGHPHVLDFGLARRFGEADEESRVTRTSEFVGTPVYAAPEQLDGDEDALDPRVDVYALGVILYEVCTGRLPYAVRGGPDSVRAAVRRWDPLPPSQVDPSLPKELDAVLSQALDPEPAHRTASVADFASDVQAILEGRPVRARVPSPLRRARRFAYRHRGPVAVTALVFVLLSAFAIDRARHARALRFERDELAVARASEERIRLEAERQRRLVEERLRGVAISERRAQEMLDFFYMDVLLGIDPGDEAARARAALSIDASSERAEEAFAENPVRLATFHLQIAHVQRIWDRFAEAHVHAERAVELLEAVKDGDDAEIRARRASALRALGSLENDLGRFDAARVTYERAIELTEELEPVEREEELSLLLAERAAMLVRLGAWDAARSDLMRAAAEERAFAEENATFSIAARMNLAGLLGRLGSHDEAEDLYREVLSRGAARPEEQVLVASAHMSWGAMLRDTGDLERGRELLEAAVDVVRLTVGEGSTEFAQVQEELGLLAVLEGRSAEAIAKLRFALGLREKLQPEHHPDLVETRHLLGAELLRSDRFAESQQLLRKALAGYEANHGDGAVELIPILRGLTHVEAKLGRLGEAISLLDRALEIAETNGLVDVAEEARAALRRISAEIPATELERK